MFALQNLCFKWVINQLIDEKLIDHQLQISTDSPNIVFYVKWKLLHH
jgi:hypothetical protein